MRGRAGGSDVGASLVEYVLLIALIALVAIVGFRFMGSSRDNSLSRSGSQIFRTVVTP